MNYWARVTVLLALVGACAVAACGEDSKGAAATLPPIATTTTTTTIPPTTTTLPEFYIIQKGDSLSSIATMFGVDVNLLQSINEITNPNKIFSGLKLRIPQPGTTLPPTTVPFSFGDPTSTGSP